MTPRLAIRLVGIGLFVVILWNIDLGRALSVMTEVPWWGLCTALLMALALAGIRALRWRLLLNAHGVRQSMRDALVSTLESMIWGTLTPARAGELIRVHHLVADQGIAVSRAAALWAVDMGLDVAGAVIATAGLTVFRPAIFGQILPRPAALAVLAAAIGGLAFLPWLSRILASRLPRGLAAPLEVLAATPASLLLGLAGLTLGSFTAYALTVAGLAGNLPEPGWAEICVITGLTMLVAILPVTFMGFGTREAVIIGVFALHGRPPEAAVGFSFLYVASALLAVAVYFPLMIGLRRRK
ncbi:membrane protein [Paramagnetospirillum magnetotacticum MS-1]|uniref:Membrane protein n=1 Tax=Paramagnetospirillum magnetotacticum MS-1 TaxID=272627 RepID=A0A0C2YNL9_PARME|nr:lysylphosphatidylglycerol synthase transmembrane domain-containing protein [Paramagnetospirillum magnetotacticum]KIL96703.1 membrane protein [Paramagnetospirillum magnetotacticum MS-1]